MARYIEIELQQSKQDKAYKEALDRYALERKFNKAKPAQFFEYIIEGKKPVNYLYRSNNYDNWTAVQQVISTTTKKEVIITLFRHIIKIAPNFINFKDNISTIKGIAEVYGDRLRDIEDWKPKRTKPTTIIRELLQHLFANYPVPIFLEKGFQKNHFESMYLYIHIGAGNSIKKFPFLPSLNLTTKYLHNIQFAPADCTYSEAFRYAQVIGMGGDEYLFNCLMNSKLHDYTNATDNKLKLEKDDFWITVIKFFIDNPMISPDKISEIIDYIDFQKYNQRRIVHDGGKVTYHIEQPNFTMKGRTPMSLLNQSEAWHQVTMMNAHRLKQHGEWEPSNIPDGLFNNGDYKYEIIQLVTAGELVQEGNRMHHCVASYANSCSKGHCTIFSFRVTNYQLKLKGESEITLEIRNKTLVQARARYNKKPHEYYMRMVKDWAEHNEINVSRWI